MEALLQGALQGFDGELQLGVLGFVRQVVDVPVFLDHFFALVGGEDPDDFGAVELFAHGAAILVEAFVEEEEEGFVDGGGGFFEFVEEDDGFLAAVVGEEIVQGGAGFVACKGGLRAEQIGRDVDLGAIHLEKG